MERKPTASADEIAAKAQQAETNRPIWKWLDSVEVDVATWREVLDRFPDCASWILGRSVLPDDVLIRLSRWPDANVRLRVKSRDRQLPQPAVDSLLHDIDPSVRLGMATWPGVTLPELENLHASSTLTSDSAIGVRGMMRLRFAAHWRDISPLPKPRCLSPYEDAAEISSLLAGLGHPGLDALYPDASSGWLDAASRSGEIRNWAAFSGLAPERLLAAFTSSNEWRNRKAVAESPYASASHLAALALDHDRGVRSAVAGNGNTDLPTLMLLGSDDHGAPPWTARRMLSQRYGVELSQEHNVPVPSPDSWGPITTADELRAYALSPSPVNRMGCRFGRISQRLRRQSTPDGTLGPALVRNQTVPDEDVIRLLTAGRHDQCDAPQMACPSFFQRQTLAEACAEIKDYGLQSCVARSRHTPLHVLEGLLESNLLHSYDSNELRRTIASRTSAERSNRRRWLRRREPIGTPVHFVDLCASENPKDRQRATMGMAAYHGLWQEVLERSPDLAKWVAINETVGPRLLDELADWPNPEVRRWVCDHSRVWLKTLDRLAFEADPSVRRRAVYNSRLSDAQLRRLRHDADPEVAREADRRLAAREYANRLLNDPEWWRHLGNSEIV